MLLYYLLTTMHVVVCVILILVVLLQSGKGADLAGAFGGGATQTAFGSRGPASFLSKMTTVAAVLFMITSMGLSMISTKTESKSILETGPGSARPAAKAPAPAQPQIPAPTREQIEKQLQEAQAKQRQATQPAAKTAPTSPAAAPGKSDVKPAETKPPSK